MAVHDGERFLARQLRSIVEQLRPGDQLVLVDDASSDGSADILARVAWPWTERLRHAVCLGAVRSFEAGLRLARTDIVFLSDQDDVWLPGKRERFVAAFEANPRVTAVVSDARVVDADERTLDDSYLGGLGGFAGGVVATLWRNRYQGCSLAVRARVLSLALPIPAGAPMHDAWLGVVSRTLGPTVYLDEPLLLHRRHGRNASPTAPRPFGAVLRSRAAFAGAYVARRLARRR